MRYTLLLVLIACSDSAAPTRPVERTFLITNNADAGVQLAIGAPLRSIGGANAHAVSCVRTGATFPDWDSASLDSPYPLHLMIASGQFTPLLDTTIVLSAAPGYTILVPSAMAGSAILSNAAPC